MKRKLSEKQIGYLLILPAVAVILAIAIWPVLRSFWFSMFDLRLNNPTKSEIHTQYSIDLERYANNFPYLIKAVGKELQDAESSAKEELQIVNRLLSEMNEKLSSDKNFKSSYEEAKALVDETKPVPKSIRFAEVNEDTSRIVTAKLEDATARIQKLAESDQLKKPKDLTGLANEVKGSIIEPNFIGFTHYKYFLQDLRLWTSLSNTMIFTILSVFVELVLGLMIALLINKSFKGRGLVRASVLVPWAIPTVVSALMWKFMYDGQYGIVAKVFESIGLVSNMGVLLTSQAGAMFSVIFADVWKTTPYMALLLLAGLQTIPTTLYEAAEVDGANRWQQFWKITLPLLKPTILVALLFRTLDAFRIFDLIYVLTGGGPANSTETISVYAYKTMFAQMDFGAGSALSVIVFLCVALISIAYIKLLGADLIGDGK